MQREGEANVGMRLDAPSVHMLHTRTSIGELYKVRATAVHSVHEFFVQLDSRETAAALESIAHELLNLDNFVCTCSVFSYEIISQLIAHSHIFLELLTTTCYLL